jgi:hypothetical protein
MFFGRIGGTAYGSANINLCGRHHLEPNLSNVPAQLIVTVC